MNSIARPLTTATGPVPMPAPLTDPSCPIPLDDAEAGRLAGEGWADAAPFESLDYFRQHHRALLKLAGSSPYRVAFCEAVIEVIEDVYEEPCCSLA